ncbi:hypothetical protein BST23_04220 [Mycolicibacterium elephantis]|uniref:Uncharacterized protein n=1 Tax=Mycolicibacterium elephantis TaxID=81858 RepID=A0A1X0D7D2_9MYCO|nr:hypothetical protein [Mycolicibacterium elephantis]ORA68293.1 hypothetical protein BST23_04220 [Mycolicibacterium elephantis]
MSAVELLQPDPTTLVVSMHPNRTHGRRVSMAFTDGHTGHRYQLVLDPEATDYVTRLLATAIKSPRITAMADQIEAAQREQ